MRNKIDADALITDLTAAQRSAVECIDGPVLVIAGPGSGKTRVITRRIAYMLAQGIRPYQILAITFTNKAAAEMKRRVEEIVPGQGVWISTFHSFGVRILRQYADRLQLDKNFTIYDMDDRSRLIKSALAASSIDSTRFSPDSIGGAISKAKNQLLTPAAYAHTARDFFTQVVAQVYVNYEKKMRDASALDFDDLLYWPALALKNDPEFRSDLDARFRYVLVDEYQDTNKAQYAIARQLSQDYQNLCVVGDPDQSIYKWRGSDIRNILDFERDFPSAQVIPLGENFRSTQAILAAADSLIRHNVQRKAKDLTTKNAAGAPVRILLFEHGLEEAEGIVKRIKEEVAEGKHIYRDYAILLRMNALTRNLESAFVRQRVPFQIVRGLAFFDRKENKDILAYLRLLINSRDTISFLRIVNEPPRGIGKTSLDHLVEYAEAREMSLCAAAAEVDKIPSIKGKAATSLKFFTKMLAELREYLVASPDEVMRQVLERTGYRKMLKTSDDPDDQERLANIEELITAAHQFHLEDETRTIADFCENVTLTNDVDGWDEKKDLVSVMTLHAAKGLEFPVIYMLGMEQGILPHERSMGKEEDVEEERRLAFVGMTRARDELLLTRCRMREFRGQTLYAVQSMFLDELPKEVEEIDLSSSQRHRPSQKLRSETSSAARGWYDTGVFDRSPKKTPEAATPLALDPNAEMKKYHEGMLVQHDQYGVGQITLVSGHGVLQKIKIRFTTAGERTFLAQKAKLAIVKGELED